MGYTPRLRKTKGCSSDLGKNSLEFQKFVRQRVPTTHCCGALPKLHVLHMISYATIATATITKLTKVPGIHLNECKNRYYFTRSQPRTSTSPSAIKRRMASERRDLGNPERVSERDNSGIRSQRSSDQRAQEEDEMPCVQEKPVLPEAAEPPLWSSIQLNNPPGRGVKTLARKHGTDFDRVSEVKHGREGVGELQDTE